MSQRKKGRGPVKHVQLNRHQNLAIIEFSKLGAVETVMSTDIQLLSVINISLLYLMTAMLIMGKYFSYLTACAVSMAVMQVEKILSHLPGGKESTFLTPRSVVKVTFQPSDS